MISSSRIQHPLHEHGLVLRDLSENFSFDCRFCYLPAKCSPAYQCPECEDTLIIHKSCAELAPQIQHPYHPEHPLILSETYLNSCGGCNFNVVCATYGYECEVCQVWLDVGCAVATLPPPVNEHEQEEKVIQHYFHEHPLTSFHVNGPIRLQCKACHKEISGIVYGCRCCMFMLHESYALLPREILKHPFHPQHPLTFLVPFKSEIVYRCDECDFDLDAEHAVLLVHPSIDKQSGEEQGRRACHHFSHPHELIKVHATTELRNKCGFCWEKVSGDFYCCPDCLFMLHESCAELSEEIVHPLHPDHPLIYQPSPTYCHICHGRDPRDYSDRVPRDGASPFAAKLNMRFCCADADCTFAAHVACAVQSLFALRAGVAPTFQNFHGHPMSLEKRAAILDSDCNVCGRPCGGLCYYCRICYKETLHIECAVPSELKHTFHPQHPLTLLKKPWTRSARCNACAQPFFGNRFIFYCADCEFQMHAGCALQKPRLKYQRHEHDLTYFETTGHLLCDLCYEDCSIDLYRCVPCNYNIHYGCMHLPRTVKHEHHIHPMELRDRVVVEYLGLDDQYCDLCETIRHPEHGVYYCDKCYCAAHIDCVIPKDERRKLGEELMLQKLDEDIESENVKTEELKLKIDELKKKQEASNKNLVSLENKKRQIMGPQMLGRAGLDSA